MNVWMAADMKYSFVEMRTADLATAAIALDKVELCGRALNVGRPSGYVAPSGPSVPNPYAGGMAAMQAMVGAPAMGGMGGMMGMMGMMGGQAAGANDAGVPSKAICLENMLTEAVRTHPMTTQRHARGYRRPPGARRWY